MLRKKSYSLMAGLLSLFMVLTAIFSPVSFAKSANEDTSNSHLTIKIPRNGKDADENSSPRELKVYKISDKNLSTDELVSAREKYDAMTTNEIENKFDQVGEVLTSKVEKDDNGKYIDLIELKGLKAGAYLLKETDESSEKHEYRVISSTTNIQDGIIDEQEIKVKVELNKPLKLHKFALVDETKDDKKEESKESKEKKEIALAGVKFNLIDSSQEKEVKLKKAEDGTYSYENNSGEAELVTDKEGNIIINNLPKGNYYFKEIETIDDYVIDNPNTEKFDYSRKNGYELNKINKKGTDKSKKVKVSLHKTDEDTKKNLAGVEFRLYLRTGDLLTPVGKDEKGNYDVGEQYTDVFKTDENGNITVEDLPALSSSSNEYVFIETKAIDDYYLDKDNNYPVKNNDVVEIENYKNPTPQELKITKVDSFTDEPIDKVGFELYKVRVIDNGNNTKKITEEKVVVAGSNGSYEYKDNIAQSEQVYQLYSDSNGQISVKNLPDGEYFFREKEPHKDYDLAENHGKETERLRRNNTSYTLKNRPINPPGIVPPDSKFKKGSYNFVKVDDSKDKKRLAGATFALYKIDENGKAIPYEMDGKRYTVKSGSNGEFKVEDLTYGKYLLRETAAPSGYILDTKPIEFTISEKSATAEAIMIVNKPDQAKPPVVTPPGNTPPGSTTPPTTTRTSVPPTNTPRTYYVPKDRPGLSKGPLVKTGDIRIIIFVVIGLVMILFGNHIVRKEEKTQLTNIPLQ